MSIESDLDTFKYIALEEQIRLPYYLREEGCIDSVYNSLDPLLEEIVDEHKITVSGEVYIPDISDVGQYVHSRQMDCFEQPLIGMSCGVEVSSRSRLDKYSEDDRLIIGYWVGLTAINRTSPLERTYSKFFAFAPVETSALFVPELIVPPGSLLPEKDDSTAMQIDIAVLSEPVNFTGLDKVFDTLEDEPKQKAEYYISYLNTIFPLSDYIIEVDTSRLISEKETDVYFDMIDEDTEITMQIKPKKFEFHPLIDGLSMVVYAEQSSEQEAHKLLVPVHGLSRATFERI